MKEARQRKTNTAWYHLYVKSKKEIKNSKVKFTETENRKVEKWLPGAGGLRGE